MNYLLELNKDNRTFPDESDKVWFVVYTKARQEQVAVENLARQGFEAYCPSIAITKRRKGQLASIIEPFFPRYIFLNFDLVSDNWAPLRSTRGVANLVKFGGIPQQVPESLVTALKDNENSDNLQIVAEKTWKKGDSVEIEQGPFAGYRCLFESERSADRVSVLLDIVGKPTRTTLQRQDLQLPQFA